MPEDERLLDPDPDEECPWDEQLQADEYEPSQAEDTDGSEDDDE